jgi:hypothetical protein
MTTPDPAAAKATARTTRAVPRALPRLLPLLFPFLPQPARIAASILTAATTIATALAWAGGLGNAGIVAGLRPVPLFAALVLTGFTVAAAALPRYAYRWLQRHDWPTDPSILLSFGAHILPGGALIVLLNVADGPSSTILAGVSAFGAVLWFVHEALTARRIHETATTDSG